MLRSIRRVVPLGQPVPKEGAEEAAYKAAEIAIRRQHYLYALLLLTSSLEVVLSSIRVNHAIGEVGGKPAERVGLTGILIVVDSFALCIRLALLGTLAYLARYHRAEATLYLHDMRLQQHALDDDDDIPADMHEVMKRQKGLSKAMLRYVRRGHMLELAAERRNLRRFFQVRLKPQPTPQYPLVARLRTTSSHPRGS